MVMTEPPAIRIIRDLLLRQCLTALYAQTGEAVTQDPLALCRLREAATLQARRLLYEGAQTVMIDLPFLWTDSRHEPRHFSLEIRLPADPTSTPV